MRRIRALLLAALTLALPAEVAAIHARVGEPSPSGERIRDMFLGRISTWEDGSPVVIVLAEDAAADTALAQVVGRDRARLVRGWKRLVYSGSGAMPLGAPSVREALELVARHPGAIAIVPTAIADARWRNVPLERR